MLAAKEEGEDQISRFLKKNKEFCLIHPQKKGYLDQEGYETNKESGMRIMPFFEEGLGGTEGFFIAYLHLKKEKVIKCGFLLRS